MKTPLLVNPEMFVINKEPIMKLWMSDAKKKQMPNNPTKPPCQ